MATTTPSTATTTPADARKPGGPGRWLRPVLGVAFGAALLALAVPRTMAAFAALDAEPALFEVSWGRTPATADTATGIAALKRAIAWVPSARRLSNLATLELEMAWPLPAADPRRRETALSAEAHFVESLTLNPADGIAWTRLAMTRQLLERPARDVIVCLTQSLDMAPNLRALWLPRGRLLLVYWPKATVDESLAMRRQLQTIWINEQADRRPLAQIARDTGQLAFLQWAIGDDATVQAQFREIVAGLPPR